MISNDDTMSQKKKEIKDLTPVRGQDGKKTRFRRVGDQ